MAVLLPEPDRPVMMMIFGFSTARLKVLVFRLDDRDDFASIGGIHQFFLEGVILQNF